MSVFDVMRSIHVTYPSMQGKSIDMTSKSKLQVEVKKINNAQSIEVIVKDKLGKCFCTC